MYKGTKKKAIAENKEFEWCSNRIRNIVMDNKEVLEIMLFGMEYLNPIFLIKFHEIFSSYKIFTLIFLPIFDNSYDDEGMNLHKMEILLSNFHFDLNFNWST